MELEVMAWRWRETTRPRGDRDRDVAPQLTAQDGSDKAVTRPEMDTTSRGAEYDALRRCKDWVLAFVGEGLWDIPGVERRICFGRRR